MSRRAGTRGFFTGFPEIDLPAVHRRLEAPLAIWYLARLHDHQGSGVVAVRDPRRSGSLAPATRWRLLRRGDEVFWTLAGERLFLRGPGAVAAVFAVRRLTTAYRAPASFLRGRRQLLRARLFLQALSVLHAGRPIPIATMAGLAGVSRRTIQDWLHLTRWPRMTNAALLERLQDPVRAQFSRSSLDGQMLRVSLRDGVWLARRLPDSLEPAWPPSRKRRRVLHRANSELPSCDLRDSGEQQLLYLIRPGRQHPLPSQYSLKGRDRTLPALQLWIPGREVPK